METDSGLSTQHAVTVGFSTTGKWMSWIIRQITRAPVSHAWISFYDHCLDTRLVMQAETWGYEVRPRNRWNRQNRLVAEFELPPVSTTAALRALAVHLGAAYDFRSAFLVGVQAWVRRWISSGFTLRPSKTPKKLMCSEAVVRFLQDLKLEDVAELNAELTPPGDLLKVVIGSSTFKPIHEGGV